MREHARAVTAYARAITSDPWTADDAVQETFLRAWKYQDSFRGAGSYEGWLLRICRNVVIDLASGRHVDRLDPLPLPGNTERLADHRAPESSIEIDQAIAALPVAQREVVTLCGVLGYDYDAAAELLGVPVGTVRSRLHRARTALAVELADVADERTA